LGEIPIVVSTRKDVIDFASNRNTLTAPLAICSETRSRSLKNAVKEFLVTLSNKYTLSPISCGADG
jgi:hypothetical protein